jgi:hypothetical protein
MRAMFIAGLAAICLSGCSLSGSEFGARGGDARIPRAINVVLASAPAPRPAAAQPDTIDVTTVLHSAIAVPAQLTALQRAITWGAILLGSIGAVNAVLLILLLSARTSPATAAGIGAAALSTGTTSAGPRPRANAVQPRTEAGITCACGSPISARSKTGRCRRCAFEQRARAQRAGATVTRAPGERTAPAGVRNRWAERLPGAIATTERGGPTG